MQTNRRFVEDKHRITLPFSHLAGQFQTLCFPAGKARGFLAKRQITQPQIFQYGQSLAHAFHVMAGLQRGLHIHGHQLRQ